MNTAQLNHILNPDVSIPEYVWAAMTAASGTSFSVLVFMCRDPGDATSKVSCCVQTSYCFKNRDFDANIKVPVALPLKWVWPENENTVNLKSATFIIIMVLHEGVTRVHSQTKPQLYFGESFTLNSGLDPEFLSVFL